LQQLVLPINAPHGFTKLLQRNSRNIDAIDDNLPGDEMLVDTAE
jgi:hypothetical protein